MRNRNHSEGLKVLAIALFVLNFLPNFNEKFRTTECLKFARALTDCGKLHVIVYVLLRSLTPIMLFSFLSPQIRCFVYSVFRIYCTCANNDFFVSLYLFVGVISDIGQIEFNFISMGICCSVKTCSFFNLFVFKIISPEFSCFLG